VPKSTEGSPEMKLNREETRARGLLWNCR